ncbi:MAG: hypothetical protein HZB12_01115 [Candidatus Yonathbacteria bacterium]|nr:hypothetical protein [Candidatus Yonathbacteria bacterium]
MDSSTKNAILLLKIGVAFAFIYPALSAFIDPSAWIGYVPMWVESLVPREIFLLIFSPLEIIVALGVLFWNKQLPSIVAGVMLITIVVLNGNEFSIVFRDISIAIMAFALALSVKK